MAPRAAFRHGPQALMGLLIAAAACVHGAGATGRLQALESALDGSGKDTPIQRVVKLLQEMKAQLEQESQADADAYDKMVCWCETNDKEKTKAIADADAAINELMAEAEGFASRDGALGASIEQLKKEIAAQKEALATATAIREKEYAEFSQEEKEMMEAITMLKNAILVLSRHHAGLLQFTPALQESVGAAMRWVALKHEEMLEMKAEQLSARRPQQGGAFLAVATRAQSSTAAGTAASAAEGAILQALQAETHGAGRSLPPQFAAKVLATAAAQQGSSFAQQEPGQFDQKPTHLQAYAPQSGQVFGILKEMKEEFEVNLSDAQKQEMQSQEEYKALKAAAEKQISADAAKLDEMETEYAANTKALADAKEDLQNTRETRAADVEFLRNLKLKCQDLDHEYGQRTKARSEEITAVTDAIAILTDDDAKDLFHKKMGTGGAAFVQLRASATTEQRAARSRAARALLRAARRQEPYQVWRGSDEKPHEQLAAMAVQVQLDAFTKVKKAIDDMVAELKAQQEEEVKHRDFCTEELSQNEKMTYTTEQALSDLEDKIASLEATIGRLNEEIATAKEEIAAMQVEVKKASELREQENAAFQEEVNDQRTMQNILQKAIARLEVAYKKEALVQQAQEPPVKFQPYKQNKGASPVINLLEQIVEDSKAVEADAVSAEQEAQKAYESFVNDANASQKALETAIAAKGKAIAAADVELEESRAQEASTKERLEDLGEYKADLHQECDFVLKNFEIRQQARLKEIEALQSAKAYLSGMNDEE